ncbi:hypothetical protein PF007_g28714 [Phytophthora fragariae]|uniref:Uncharacterized protein n=1 Tax=Phytophthora fragariae TaxID=53985 RepID=A0A6A3FZV1_9STRA|nr:hypothetical protein PF009_g63 [Phytophthora fragariae]KAE9065825.1 hypothetical protein PF007_g28714 [Phytophthora fragariae]KAE9072687.1 hypothetical protein PF006_g28875 [Phytophthora fragariae]KAE9271118.1 hypothetical protein PF001_g28523 [Phytophthora fragariae]
MGNWVQRLHGCHLAWVTSGLEQTASSSTTALRGALALADARDERVSRPHELDEVAVLGGSAAAEEAAAALLELDAVVAVDGQALVAAVEQVAHSRNWVSEWT